MRRISLLALALLLACASVALAKTTKKLSAVEDSTGLHYSKSKLTVAHGKVTLKVKNPADNHLEHSIDIRGHGIDAHSEVVKPGGTAVVSAKLKKGKTYTFYCQVKDHEADGMKGTIKVN
jgi:uncharacterized cupredoxin-like copper-binding protein